MATYQGWSLFRFILLPAIVSDLVLTMAQWGRRSAFRFALAGFLLISGSLAVFLTWTLPANIATNNWTVVPTNWQQLRVQWEYSHAVAAILDFFALCSVILSALL